MEKDHPGLWQLWFKHQCVTVGYSVETGFRIEGGKKRHDWIVARNALEEIRSKDLIIASLPGCRIGRIGRVLEKKYSDEDWNPLIPGDAERKEGYMGRRILVHWEMERAPDSPDLIVQLPAGVNMGRGTLTQVKHHSIQWFRETIANPTNWVGMVGRFGYEKALSDYIAHYPHRLKDGLQVYPNQKIREKVFDDDSRADVLLIDADRKPVIVECKQDSPKERDIKQLRCYIKNLKKETGELAKGILVHGGARTVDKKVWRVAKTPRQVEVEIFQYKLDVDFLPSC